MSTLYVMVGIPASGKSTKAQELVEKGAVKVSSDLIRKELFGEEEIHYTDEWLRETGYDGPDERAAKEEYANNTLFDLLFERCSGFLSKGFDVITDSTSCSRFARKRVLDNVRNADRIVCIVMAVPFELCCIRNRLRDRVVPDYAMKRIAGNFQFPDREEGFDEIVYIGNKEDIDYGEARSV